MLGLARNFAVPLTLMLQLTPALYTTPYFLGVSRKAKESICRTTRAPHPHYESARSNDIAECDGRLGPVALGRRSLQHGLAALVSPLSSCRDSRCSFIHNM